MHMPWKGVKFQADEMFPYVFHNHKLDCLVLSEQQSTHSCVYSVIQTSQISIKFIVKNSPLGVRSIIKTRSVFFSRSPGVVEI